MSDTPKTDAFISKFYKSRPLSSGSRHRTDVELHDFARQLERELAALREKLVQALAIAKKYEPDEKTNYIKYASDEIAELLKEEKK